MQLGAGSLAFSVSSFVGYPRRGQQEPLPTPDGKENPLALLRLRGVEFDDHYAISPDTWQEHPEKVALIAQSLVMLPERFYTPKGDEHFVLYRQSASVQNGGPKTFFAIAEGSYPIYAANFAVLASNNAEADGDELNPNNPLHALKNVTRKTVFAVLPRISSTGQEVQDPVSNWNKWLQSFNDVLKDGNIISSDGEPVQIDNIAQMETFILETFHPENLGADDSLLTKHSFPAFLNEIYATCAQDIDYNLALGVPVGNTLLPTMASHYVLGKTYFLSMYNQLFDAKTTERLYTFIQGTLFENKEYPLIEALIS